MKYDYSKTLPLNQELSGVECWNLTGGERFTLPAGTLIRIEHAYDSTNATCMAVNAAGEAVALFPNAYRWIIPNAELSRVTGAKLPKRSRDIVGEILAYESGQATPKQAARLLRSPVCRKLQGHYSSRCK